MKKLIVIMLIPAMLMWSSCEKYLECEDCKTDPNNPSVTTPSMLLTIGEVVTFSNYEGNLARVPQIWTQHLAGTDFQYFEFAKYNQTDNDLENEWNQLYGDCFINMKELLDDFGAGNPWYTGMAKVLIAVNLGLTTDTWGDVPWAQALQGTENLNPAYDSQEQVYQAIQSLLDDAIADLGQPAESNTLFPSSDDLVYGGDPNQWIKIAWALKARYANHLSKRDPVGSATAAINNFNSAISAGFTSSADDFNAVHGAAGNELNQWYSFNNERSNYIKMGETLVELMKSINDPRLPFYAAQDDNGNYTGTPAGDNTTSTSNMGDYFSSPAAPAPIVTYVELKFIEAEAKFRSGDLTGAANAHNDAIKAHVALITGGPDAAFETAQASETSGTITLTKIMTQKYIAMFTQAEAWTDWRRTDIPNLTPVSGSQGIPRRFVTPQGENVNNANSPKETNLVKKMWWDE